jgi:hypothetical protein
MKQTSKIILEDLDVTLSDLLDEVAKMRATLSSAQTSLTHVSVSLSAKPQARATLLTSAVGRKRLKQKQKIMRNQERLKKNWYFLQS